MKSKEKDKCPICGIVFTDTEVTAKLSSGEQIEELCLKCYVLNGLSLLVLQRKW